MARRGVTGQLNMFDFFKSLEDIPPGEVEMVSLMPNFEEEPVVSEEPKPTPKQKPKPRVTRKSEKPKPVEEPKQPIPVEEPKPVEESEKPMVVEKPKPVLQVCTDDTPVMSRSYEIAGEHIEIAYLKYNKVRICHGQSVPEIKEFETTKDAVDYYVEQIQELEADDE